MRLIQSMLLAGISPMVIQEVSLSEVEVEAIAIEAYIYGYPLITIEMTRRLTTNVAKPDYSQG